MARWEMNFALDRHDVPLFQQITPALTSDIQRGRLRPGDELPGTRTLARALGVQRQTVTAFDELVAEGWIVNRPS
jgi:GntR family transcriptional regulator / MocR family aminotransferase